YQRGPSCAEPSPAHATTTVGWVGAQTTRRAPVRAAHDVERRLAVVHVRPRSRAHVLAVVATHRTRAGATVVRRPRRPRRAREVASAAGARASGDWRFRSLVALIGLAMLGLLVAAVSDRRAAGTAVTGMRTRLASKGLSGSRIQLGPERAPPPRRGSGISYRD